MKSAEFYAIIDEALEPECKRLGFARMRGTVSLWWVDLPTGRFFYEISKGVKNPYIPYIGGRFKVDCDLVATKSAKDRNLDTGISYMEYFSEADLEEMREIQDGVLTKIVNQQPPEEFDRLMLEAHAPMLRMIIGSRFNPHGVFTLPYLDAEDVTAWGKALAARLEKTIAGARERPVFFMRIERTE